MDRTQLRGRIVLGSLGVAAIVAACAEEFTGVRRVLPSDPLRYEVWQNPPPPQCRIGFVTTNLLTLSTIPTVDTACGTTVTMSWPAFNDPAIPPQEHTFWWLHSEPGPWPGKVTGYGTGSRNDKLNGPITYTFSRAIGRFAMQIQLIDSVGHYMLAFDQFGGLVDSESFNAPGVGTWRSDVQELTGINIRRVVIHAPLNGPNGFGDFSPKDTVVRQAAFDTASPPCPPVGDPVFDSAAVRDTIIGVYNAVVSSGNELAVLVYKNPFRLVTPTQTRGPCAAVFAMPTPLGYMDPDLLAYIHAHGYGRGEANACNGGIPYNVFFSNGLSEGDVDRYINENADRVGVGLPTVGWYVIDKDKIWRNAPGDPLGSNLAKGKAEDRVRTACRWR